MFAIPHYLSWGLFYFFFLWSLSLTSTFMFYLCACWKEGMWKEQNVLFKLTNCYKGNIYIFYWKQVLHIKNVRWNGVKAGKENLFGSWVLLFTFGKWTVGFNEKWSSFPQTTFAFLSFTAPGINNNQCELVIDAGG